MVVLPVLSGTALVSNRKTVQMGGGVTTKSNLCSSRGECQSLDHSGFKSCLELEFQNWSNFWGGCPFFFLLVFFFPSMCFGFVLFGFF